MATEHRHITLVRRAYSDFESGDLDLLRTVMWDHAVWHEPGRSVLAGDYKGHEEIMGLLAQLRDRSCGTFKAEILAAVADEERTVIIQRETADREGAHLDVMSAVEFEIHAERITEATVYHGDSYQFDEFWGATAGS